ncbi:MAG TPA: CHAT domain-containing protein, partial [Catalimonadaceae bacterium]|nr:CHAT domain-containing protein [Catalimonadaceae bacterium]
MFTKALLLSSSTKWKNRILNCKDSVIINKFEAWEQSRNQLAHKISSGDTSNLRDVPNLKNQVEENEKELTRLSSQFQFFKKEKEIRWTDVRKKLKPGEAAIEMVRLAKYGTAKIFMDTTDPRKPFYSIKDLTDTIQYAALIVKSHSKYPELVLLENGNDLENKWINLYRNNITKQLKDSYSYQQYWKRINEKLGSAIKKVYFSPDGIYNSINLNTLQNPRSGKYLLEEKDIQMVTNTKDILLAGINQSNPSYACLVGYPDYNTSKEKRESIYLRERNSPKAFYTLNTTRNESFSELPGTKQEVENISTILKQKKWQVETYLGENALEETIEEIQKPRILHIATHGFFHRDSTQGTNQLIRSGLLLSGANKTLAGERDDQVEDGILTAYEAMNLNLDNTDLVVLSACETGLGEIKNGEGVYGLQRAFKVAGAKTIIMSLWKVDDEATQELMVSFYKHWLSKQNIGKRAAFL